MESHKRKGGLNFHGPPSICITGDRPGPANTHMPLFRSSREQMNFSVHFFLFFPAQSCFAKGALLFQFGYIETSLPAA